MIGQICLKELFFETYSNHSKWNYSILEWLLYHVLEQNKNEMYQKSNISGFDHGCHRVPVGPW